MAHCVDAKSCCCIHCTAEECESLCDLPKQVLFLPSSYVSCPKTHLHCQRDPSSGLKSISYHSAWSFCCKPALGSLWFTSCLNLTQNICHVFRNIDSCTQVVIQCAPRMVMGWMLQRKVFCFKSFYLSNKGFVDFWSTLWLMMLRCWSTRHQHPQYSVNMHMYQKSFINKSDCFYFIWKKPTLYRGN